MTDEKTPEDLLYLYRLLAKTRALNETLIINRKKIFGACLTGIGQEAVSVSPMLALLDEGILLESIKNGDHRTNWGLAVVTDELTKDKEGHNHAKEILRNHFGKATGGNRGRDGNIHWGCLDCRILDFMCSDMGRLAGVTAGYAEEIRRMEWPGLRKSERPVGIAFFGEGAAQQGAIHEAMNWVAASNCKSDKDKLVKIPENLIDGIAKETGVIRGSPMIFVIVKNQQALFTDADEEHGNSALHERAPGYGDMVGVEVDGDNPLEMYSVSRKAIEQAQGLTSTLIVANTYRRTGHNEDQILRRRDALEKRDFAAVKNITGLDNIEEFERAWEYEPLLRLRKQVIDKSLADGKALDNVLREERDYMDALTEKTLAEPGATVEKDQKDRTIFPPINWEALPQAPNSQKGKKMGYNKAFNWIVGQLMREDEKVTYFGEDVSQGGILGYSKDLTAEFGPMRIFNSPLSEEAVAATAAGRSLHGSTAFGEFQFAPFWRDAAPILAVIGRQWFQRKLRFRLNLVYPSGIVREGGSGEWHEEWPESEIHATGKAGIVIAAPSNAYDAVGLTRAAYSFDGPVAILLQIAAANYPEFEAEIPEEPYVIPFGEANIVKEGSDFTVVTYGAACVAAAKNEAEFLEKEEGISVEVIDLRTLCPLDLATLRNSIRKTGRCAVMHEAAKSTGFGRAIISELVTETDILKKLLVPKIYLVCAGMEMDESIPSTRELIWARLPYYKAEIKTTDKKGRPLIKTTHRSSKLTRIIKEGMRYE